MTVSYSGDRVYGRSTGTLSVTVAKSAITGIKIPTFPDPTDIDLPFCCQRGLAAGTVPSTASETPFQYSYIMKVGTAAGVPTGSITVMDNSTACPPELPQRESARQAAFWPDTRARADTRALHARPHPAPEC